MKYHGFCGIFLALFIFAGCDSRDFSLSELQARAKNDNTIAQRELGRAYMTGNIGAARNIDEAVKWLTRASNRGDVMAPFFLGQLYARGEGVPKDEQKAITLFQQSAEKGAAGAQHALGVRYALGQGAPKDFGQAVKWYRKAAEQGLAEAQDTLALRYARGEGVPVNDAEAVKWFRRAAEQGIRDAQLNLAQRYGTGEGVKKDLVEAYKWAVILDENWLQKKYSKEMSPAQIKEAEEKAAAFTPALEISADDPPQSNLLLWAMGIATVGLYGGVFYMWRLRSRKPEVTEAVLRAS